MIPTKSYFSYLLKRTTSEITPKYPLFHCIGIDIYMGCGESLGDLLYNYGVNSEGHHNPASPHRLLVGFNHA